jgi:hypothetical protein
VSVLCSVSHASECPAALQSAVFSCRARQGRRGIHWDSHTVLICDPAKTRPSRQATWRKKCWIPFRWRPPPPKDGATQQEEHGRPIERNGFARRQAVKPLHGARRLAGQRTGAGGGNQALQGIAIKRLRHRPNGGPPPAPASAKRGSTNMEGAGLSIVVTSLQDRAASLGATMGLLRRRLSAQRLALRQPRGVLQGD